MKTVTERKIICPYCFEEFEHDQVHFRLETVKNEGYDLSDIEHESDLQKKEEMQLSMYFQPKDDRDYSRFWSGYGTTTEITTNNERTRFGCEVYQLPIIDPTSSEAGRCLRLQDHGNGQNDYFQYDGYGMVRGVEDIYGAISHRRVCPKCHNPLPNGYGQNKTKFISVIGVTRSGKTVYISQLLKNMATYSHNLINMSTVPTDDRVENFINNNPVKRNVMLPDSTMAGRLAQPMTYDIVKLNGEHETIVIYDIAGENCKNATEMERYGDFVMHSDGIILLISPNQMGFIEDYGDRKMDDNTEDAAPPRIVLNTIYNTIVGQNQGKCEIPLAVCISKSDFFAKSLGEGEENGTELVEIATSDVCPFEDSVTGNKKYGFNATKYNVIQKKITKMMESNPISGDLQRQYKYYNYFIFSAIGCAVRKEEKNGQTVSYPVDDPTPIRIAEPLMWLFKRFGYIKSDTPIRLPHHRGSKENLDEIRIPLNPTWFERVILKKPEWRYLTPEEKAALWYEETC